MVLCGLKNCDTCRRALRELGAAGRVAELRDIRDKPLSEREISLLVRILGEALVNRRSTTWRRLDTAERARPVPALLARYPALMKRPVIEWDGNTFLGWGEETRNILLKSILSPPILMQVGKDMGKKN